MSADRFAAAYKTIDALLGELMSNIDEERYRAREPVDALRWGSLARRVPRALWHSRRFIGQTASAFWNPERFYRYYERVIADAERDLKQSVNARPSPERRAPQTRRPDGTRHQ